MVWWKAIAALILVPLSACSSSVVEVPKQAGTTTSSPSPTSFVSPIDSEPVSDDYIQTKLVQFDVDDDASFIIPGHISVEYSILNTTESTIYGIATSIFVEDLDGNLLYIKNLNQEFALKPNSSRSFGFFGETKIPLLRVVPQWETLLDMTDPALQAKVRLQIRKILLADGQVVEIVKEVPSQELPE